MKLANRLLQLVEKFNGGKSFISDYFKLKFADADTVLNINLDRGSVTKGLICVKGDKARLIEIDLKVNIGASLGMGYGTSHGISPKKYITTENTVDFYVQNIQKLLDKDIYEYSEGGTRYEAIKKKFGTGKITADSGWLPKEDVAELLVKNGMHLSQIKKLPEFADIKDIETGGMKLEGFDLIGFSDAHAPLFTALKDAVALLKKNGYEKLIYGQFYSMPKRNAKNSVLADYTENLDDIRVFDISSKGEVGAATKTILHELFHRYYYKFLTREQRSKVFVKYHEAIMQHKAEVKDKVIFNTGDKFYIQGKRVQYDGIKPITRAGRKVAPIFLILDAQDKPTSKYYYYKNLVDAALAIDTQEGNVKRGVSSDFVPSAYSRTNEKEWFSEVVSFGMMNNSKPVLDWLKTL